MMHEHIRMGIVKLNACTPDFAGDIFTHERTSSIGAGNSLRSREADGET